MPRLSNNIFTKKNDLKKYILSKMAAEGIRQADMAEVLGISQPAFSQKLRKGQFDYSDLWSMFQQLRPTDEDLHYLFK